MNYNDQYNWNRVEWLYQLARSKKLDATAVRVGLLFATFLNAEDRETVRPSYEWIMENARIRSRTTLSRALKALEDEGFLVIARMRRYRSEYSMPFDCEAHWKR